MALRLAPLAALAVVAAVTGWGLVPAVAAGETTITRVANPPVAATTLAGPAAAASDLTRKRVEAYFDRLRVNGTEGGVFIRSALPRPDRLGLVMKY